VKSCQNNVRTKKFAHKMLMKLTTERNNFLLKVEILVSHLEDVNFSSKQWEDEIFFLFQKLLKWIKLGAKTL